MILNRKVYNEIIHSTNIIENAVCRASSLYNEILKKGEVSDESILWTSGDIIAYDGDYVEIQWSSTWNYGGRDEGSYYIPSTALFDDTWEAEVTRLANVVLVDMNKKVRQKQVLREKREKAQLKSLKAKWD